MVLNVSAQIQETTVSLGSIMMESNVCINLALAQMEQLGTVLIVLPVTTVLQDFTLQIHHVLHYLKDVFHHRNGQMDAARLVKNVLMVHTSEVEAVSLIFLVKMVKLGIMI